MTQENASTWPVANTTESIEHIRQDIDRIDEMIHELLIQRATLTVRIGAAKRSGEGVARPAREAVMLRQRHRYHQEHQGLLAPQTIMRIWREIIAGHSSIQGEVSVIVCHLPDQLHIQDLARDHYGSATPIRSAATARQALTAVGERSATFAVFPVTGGDWWLQMSPERPGIPRVVARLPFYRPHGYDSSLDALVVGLCAREPTGDDQTIICGPERKFLDSWARGIGSARRWRIIDRQAGMSLIDIAGFMADSSDGSQLWDGCSEISELTVIGGYACPIAPSYDQSFDQDERL